MNDNSQTNQAVIIGTIEGAPELSHIFNFEEFYSLRVKVPRLSGNIDTVPVTVSERLLADGDFNDGSEVKVTGQFRSRTEKDDEKIHKKLAVFAQDISEKSEKGFFNHIFLDGYLCKPPSYRTTPLGREITDLLIAVNRGYKKSDYIPVIAWGRNARYSRNFNVGAHVRITGRIQSREYNKKISEVESVKMTAYEVSANSVDLLKAEVSR